MTTMKVNLTPLVLSEGQLRQVRVALGRGGKATRKDVRYWAERLLSESIRNLPDAKPARKKRVEPPAPITPGSTTDRCSICRYPRDEHGKMGGTCPPGVGRKKGTRFAA